MYRILKKTQLAPQVYRYDVEAPRIARRRKAGQFVVVRAVEEGERIPLTIASSDPVAGTITLIFQVAGVSTRLFASLDEGDGFLDVVGPLGHPTEIALFGTVACVGGGIGVAPLWPIAAAMKEAGNRVLSIVGARTADLVILEQEMRAASDELMIATDDGSRGRHGFVTDVLAELLAREHVDLVVAIGPAPMMKAACAVTRPSGTRTIVSLNPIMVDGTGMCGGCRVTVGGVSRFACVEGPEFDGHEVDFEELAKRLRVYRDEERRLGEVSGDHRCKLRATS